MGVNLFQYKTFFLPKNIPKIIDKTFAYLEYFLYLCIVKMRETAYRLKQLAITLKERRRIAHGDKRGEG